MKNWAIDWRKLATAQRRFFESTTLWKFRWLLAKKKITSNHDGQSFHFHMAKALFRY
jgi:hypothetical protein